MATPLIPGTELQGESNSYTIVELLGVASDGDVYHAAFHHNDRRIDVAMKEIDPQSYRSEDEFDNALLQFQELDHLCLPRMIESFVQDDRGFIVVEYIGGDSLQDYVGQGAQPEHKLLFKNVLTPLLNVVEYLHAFKPPYLHGDIKPDNIILPAMHKRIVLVDLGLPSPPTSADQPRTLPLSPGYSPPEQYNGYAEPRSDYYALGATIYFMLTGTRPPIATERAADDVHGLLRAARPDVSSAMQAAVTRLMALEIDRRYPDIDSIRHDLEHTPEFNQPIVADPDSTMTGATVRLAEPPTERLSLADLDAARPVPAANVRVAPAAPPRSSTGSGSRLWLWGGLLAVLLLIGSGVFYGLTRSSAPPVLPPNNSSAVAVVASEPAIPSAAASPVVTTAPSVAPSLAPSAEPSPTTSPTPDVTATPEASPTPAIVEVAGRIAFFSEQGISILRGGQQQNNISAQPSDSAPRWSPDGQRIAFVSSRQGNRDIFVMDADGANLEQLTTDAADDTYPTWSPDGAQIAFVSERGSAPNVYLVDVMTRAVEPLTANMNATVRYEDLAWAPDGKLAAAMQRDNVWNIHLIDERGDDRPITTNPNPFTVQIKAPAWRPDSEQIAYMSNEGGAWNVYASDLEGNERPVTTNTVQSIYISQPTWSPDGRQIGFITRAIVGQGDQQSYRYSINVVDAEADGAEPLPVIIDDQRLDDPDWTP